MNAKNVSWDEMHKALETINKKYQGNIKFKEIEARGKQIHFTLTVLSSKGPGSRHGVRPNTKGNYQRIAAACWHVHGDFFEELVKINDNAEIRTSMDNGNGGIINRWAGNWYDRNIGSGKSLMMYSDACDCKKG